MKKELDIYKIINYDKFKCIADKCEFTCCSGWDINIDERTYKEWQKLKCTNANIFKNIKIKKHHNGSGYIIEKKTKDHCPFLDLNKLCNVVKEHGDEYLSFTCRFFPRIENNLDNVKELSLSCACPVVLDLLSEVKEKIDIGNTNKLKTRQVLINIMQKDNISIEHKLLISYQMLLDILDENIYKEEIEKYTDINKLNKLIELFKEVEFNIYESMEELNHLFLDIIQDYKEVSIFKNIFENISIFAETINIEEVSTKWRGFKKSFEEYNDFIENCIVSKVIGSCISLDIEEQILAYEMIILEYLLIRYSVFLNYCTKDKLISLKDIKDYTVAFSRIIGNNQDAVVEFINEGFGDSILEYGYICFITLF